jgi:hypothetical protein
VCLAEGPAWRTQSRRISHRGRGGHRRWCRRLRRTPQHRSRSPSTGPTSSGSPPPRPGGPLDLARIDNPRDRTRQRQWPASQTQPHHRRWRLQAPTRINLGATQHKNGGSIPSAGQPASYRRKLRARGLELCAHEGVMSEWRCSGRLGPFCVGRGRSVRAVPARLRASGLGRGGGDEARVAT